MINYAINAPRAKYLMRIFRNNGIKRFFITIACKESHRFKIKLLFTEHRTLSAQFYA